MTAPSEETRAQPVEVTCPGCFHPREWDVAGVCPICHYRAGMEGRSAALLPVGTQLKGYVVGEKLGQGGFGITYRGFDVTLKMKVAIKEYYPSELVGRSTDRKTVVLNAHDHEDLFRYGLRTFLQEAQTVAQLRHPHLVRVLNYFELNDTAYLVMDYYEGEDLGRHLKPPKGQAGVQTPWRRALKLLLPVLDGLRKVHQAGFMHRDLKPGNLYLTNDDELIVLDFGSARQVTGTHTRSLLIFSEGYAPYEQYLQGHLNRQGPWTDIYGAAATLYFMLTARRLPSALERKQNELLRQPDPLQPARHWIPDLPPALDAALRRALAVEPDQRFQSMAEFKQPLEAVLTAEEPTRPPPPQPKAASEPPIKPPPTPPPKPKVAPEPPKPKPAPEPPKPKPAPEPPKPKPAPEPPKAPPKPNAVPERSTPPKRRTARVALAVIGLAGLGGWFWWKSGVSPPPVPPVVIAPPVVTPPVVQSPPTVAPPVVEPRAYLTIKPTPATAQIRIMNIGPSYRDGIELTPGDFDLEVSAPGYQTYRGWRTLAAGVQEVAIVLQPNTPVSLPVAPVAPPPTAADIARQKELDLQLAVVKKLLEARRIPAARRALDDAKSLDREGRVETFRREQTTVMQATALLFLEQGQRTLAERVLNDLKQWDPQSPEYQALRERLARGR
ncbi:MAG: serine/threonine-protein kinase [Candidatus Contendobacter sp.]|nr:serine/threonine-protein kinase [Candidatus Contendobacter sp.]